MSLKCVYVLYFIRFEKNGRLKKTVECDRVGISVIGLEVPHAHLHLIPINQEGDMNFTNEKIILSENEFKNLLSRIKSNLD